MSSRAALATVATGDALLALARRHIGEKYVFGVLVPKDNPNWTGPWDCAEFASWLTFQVARKLYGCSSNSCMPGIADAFSGFWQRDAGATAHRVSIRQAAQTPGAFILRSPQAGAIGHIVVSDGRGGTVEAHSAKDGVIASTLAGRRWELGILVPEIQYSAGGDIRVAAPKQKIYRLTSLFMQGPAVRLIQQQLRAAGFDPGPIDGVFGPHTQAAVVAFQLAKGLVPDGEVGPVTARALGIKAASKK